LAFEGFADVLKNDSKLAVCIIYRPPEARPFRDPEDPKLPDDPEEIDLAKLVEKWKLRLTSDYQIESRRVFIVTAAPGEYDGDGSIETWIVPPGAALPDPYAESDPTADKPKDN
jgi:hypothetical protein